MKPIGHVSQYHHLRLYRHLAQLLRILPITLSTLRSDSSMEARVFFQRSAFRSPQLSVPAEITYKLFNASRVSLNYNIVPVCLISFPTMSRMVSIWPRLQDSGIALGHAKPHLEISHSQVLLICFIPYPLDWPASFNVFIRPFLVGRVVIGGAAEELPMTF